MTWSALCFVYQSTEPLRVLITGAAGQVAYNFVHPLISGHVFGSDQVGTFHLLFLRLTVFQNWFIWRIVFIYQVFICHMFSKDTMKQVVSDWRRFMLVTADLCGTSFSVWQSFYLTLRLWCPFCKGSVWKWWIAVYLSWKVISTCPLHCLLMFDYWQSRLCYTDKLRLYMAEPSMTV